MSEKSNPHRGSDFDDFLRKEGILEEVMAAALRRVANQNMAEKSDYTPEQVEAMARVRAEAFIESMDEGFAFLSDEIAGYEIALRLIQKEVEFLKSYSKKPPDSLPE